MNSRIQVKTRFQSTCAALLLALAAAATPLHAEADAQKILETVRYAHAQQNRNLSGELQAERKSIPFRLRVNDGTIRYEFTDPPQAFVVTLGDQGSEIREVTGGASSAVATSRLDERLRGTDLTLEDVSLGFLYWKNAKVVGEDKVLNQDCYKIELHPGRSDASQYGTVWAWIDQRSGGMLKAECFDRSGKLAMRFTLRSVQRSDREEGTWLPKGMRIERIEGGKPRSRTTMEVREN